MKNLMSRDEYLQKANEGFIKDTIKKGWEKVKSFFKVCMRKIKNFIAIFDSEGHLLPVVSPQAVMDNFSSSSAVTVLGTNALNDSVTEAGGKINTSAPTFDEGTYDDGPDGDEFFDWELKKEYKNDIEYQNFMSIPSIIKEHYNYSDEEFEKLNEAWKDVAKERVSYLDKSQLGKVKAINVEKFEKLIGGLIEDWSINSGKSSVSVDGEDVEIGDPMGNILVFGAPGIGKSTVPQMVVDKFNKNVAKGDPSKMISLISINCANITAGDFMMPTMPKENDVISTINDFADTFPESGEYFKSLTSGEQKQVAATIQSSGQFKSSDAPKCWLPSWKKTGNDKIDKMLDDYSNGGVYMDKDRHTYKTGGGGIILFDELLRCDPDVFKQLMNFLLDRELNGWRLGSKWAIIACSNRPCDDAEVADVWNSWSSTPAAKDRWEGFYQLIPDPESWKTWARKKGCDELILEFIFDDNDESARDGNGEYVRWHTMVKDASEDSAQVAPISPRRWQKAFSRLGKAKIKKSREEGKKISDISELSIDEIQEALEGVFDTDFIAVFTDWLETNMDKINLDAVMKDPKSVYLPKKYVNDPAGSQVLIRKLSKDIQARYKDNPGDCTDEQLANIAIWLGMNYKEDVYAIQNFIEELVDNVFKNKSEFRILKYIKMWQVITAAYPPKDIYDNIKTYESRSDHPWPKNSIEIVKDLMREYFPWRIDGDKIKYYDDLKID